MAMTRKDWDAHASVPRHFLIVNNVQKMKKIKNMIVRASEFGVKEVFVVGQKKLDIEEKETLMN